MAVGAPKHAAQLAEYRRGGKPGICTFNGQLRIVSASHDPYPDYLNRVRDVLDAAC